IARAPERRIFYIDVGNLPKIKAEQYLREMMTKHKNRLVYDATTGEIRDDRKHMTMLEDFWLPRREGGKSTEITTLPGGQTLGEMDDVLYFQKALFRSLNVPTSRMESETGFSLGRASEISRDELKFNKFIGRLRARFSILFDEILEKQLVLKNVMTIEEWQEIKNRIRYDFQQDNHFTELKDSEILRERLQSLDSIQNYVGEYYSKEWIRKNILRMSDEDIEEMEEQIAQEKEDAPEDEKDMEQNAPPVPQPVTIVEPPKPEEPKEEKPKKDQEL
ncbi:MAG: portal protein, partial [Alphaproteobacteria bacterium]|nr:portal protein [Alphaproteobacteria bacterium]